MRRALLVLLLAVVPACGARPQIPVMRYQAQSLAVAATRAGLMRAVWRHASLNGWRIVDFDERHGTIQALTPTDDRDGVRTRTRFTFTANDGELAVVLRLELAAAGDERFETAETVCDSYRYSQERDQLRQVKSTLWRDVSSR